MDIQNNNEFETEEITVGGEMNTAVTEDYDASQIQVLEVLRLSARDRVCISARPAPPACTILYMK